MNDNDDNDNDNDAAVSKSDSETYTSAGSSDIIIENVGSIYIEIDELVFYSFNNNLDRYKLAKVIEQELPSLFSNESRLSLIRINDKGVFEEDIQSFDDSQYVSSIDAGSFNLKLGKTDSGLIGREISLLLFKALIALMKT
jgi:hypothetical protein